MELRGSALCAVVLFGCGPFLLFPGGKLEGPVKPTPSSFAFATSGATIQLETRPEDPYSVNVTSAIVGNGLYVSAGNSRSHWVQNIEVTPLVRARVGGDVYELRARRVVDAAEMDAFAGAWLSRNSWARDPRKLGGETWVFRLEPRSATTH